MMARTFCPGEAGMSAPTRREFAKQSLLIALAPLASESALASAGPAPAQRAQASGQQFFSAFKREQIKTTGATINVVHGGKGPPLLLLHGIPETHVMWRVV